MANRSDVQLVIRAKDEAAKAFESAAKALENLLSVNDAVGASADKAGSRLKEMADIAATLDKAYAKISGSADTAAASFARQQQSLQETKAQLAALQGQAAAAAAALAKLNSADAIVSAGRDQTGRIEQVKFLTKTYNDLVAQQNKLSASIATQEQSLQRQQSALQQVGSTAIAAEVAQAELSRQIEAQTAAIERQTQAAQRNAQVIANIERAVGITRDTGELELLNKQIAAQDAYYKKLQAEQEAKAELLRIEQARARENAVLTRNLSGKSAQGSAAVFEAAFRNGLEDSAGLLRENAAAEKELAAAAERLRLQIDPMARIQDRLNKELAEAERLYKAGKISAEELALAQKLLKDNADAAAQSLGKQAVGSQKTTLFGLSPYAITNLGYQVNDVVTQLASGTSLTQTLAQQGGQLIQIFPRVGAAIVAAFTNPVILGTGAAIVALIAGISRAANEATQLRTFGAALTASGDAANYQASALLDATRQIDRYGLSAKDAASIVRTFVKEGINPALLVEFGKAAKNMADVLGVEVPDAARRLANAFTAGYDAIKALNAETGVYTAAELALIKSLFEEGRANEARAKAFDIYSRKMQEGADKARGPWQEAVRSLSNAWDSFLSLLANSRIIQGMIRALDELGKSATSVLNRLNGTRTLDDINNDIAVFQRRVRDLNQNIAAFGDPFKIKAAQVKEYTDRLRELQVEQQRVIEQNNRVSPVDPVAPNNQQDQVNRQDRLAEIQRERERDQLKQLEGERRVSEAGRLAFEAEMRRSGDKAIAEAERQLAMERERRDVERDILQLREQQAREARDGTAQSIKLLKEFEGFRSKAYWDVNAFRAGYGSSTVTKEDGSIQRVNRDTTVTVADAERDLARRVEEFQRVIKEQIGADRFASFSAPQQAALTSIAYNYGSLPDRIIAAVKSGTSEQIATAVRGLAGDNGGVNRRRRNREADILGSENLAIEADNQRQLQERVKKQNEYFQKVDDTTAARERETRQLQEQQGLTGQALIAKQREQAIEDAIAKARQEARDAGVNENDPALLRRIEQIRQTVGAYEDLKNARASAEAPINEVQTQINALQQQRQALQQAMTFEQGRGNQAAVEQLDTQLKSVNTSLTEAIQKAIQMWQALAGDPEKLAVLGKTKAEVDGIVLSLQNAIPPADNLGKQFLMTGRQINESLANGAASAFDRLAQAIAEGKNAVESLKNAFLQFAADFLRQIAQMIIKQAIFNALSGGSAGGGGGIGGTIASAIGSIFHSGGIVGKTAAPTRAVSAAWFANATRYHNGGIAGLKPNEVPAILQRNEEVLTTSDPRHSANGGGASSPQIKIINAIDSGDMMQQGLSTKVGERAILNFMRENRGAVQAALG